MKLNGCCNLITSSALALILCGVFSTASAETRALLVGVWKFQSTIIPDLKGPENDLAAMETLARTQGATDVSVLRNEQVSRTTVETALHAMGLRSKPGDWILFYYSGHGAEAEAAVKGTRDGDLDQFLPLAKFDPDEQDPERFIVDKDFYDWIGRYIPPGVQVLMIADACHSGTLNRSIDQRAFHFTPRLAFRGDASEIQLIARPAPRFPSVLASAASNSSGGASVDRADLANLIYIAAAQDDQLALEASLPVEGAPARGLLTYTFEQGLTTPGADGKGVAADLDRDGKVTVSEMGAYLNSQVRALTGQRQETKITYGSGQENLHLFAEIKPAIQPPAAPALPSVFALDAQANSLLALPNSPWRTVADRSKADFIWDVAQGAVLRRSGDIVAERVSNAAGLRGVVEKWQAIEALRPALNEARMRVRIGPDEAGARYHTGQTVSIDLQLSAMAAAPRFLTMFNLASDGTVQTLFPLASDKDGQIAGGAGNGFARIENAVVPPFGTDHVIALLTPQPPAAFRALLRSSENQRGAGRLVGPIKALLSQAGASGALSIGELYTGR